MITVEEFKSLRPSDVFYLVGKNLSLVKITVTENSSDTPITSPYGGNKYYKVEAKWTNISEIVKGKVEIIDEIPANEIHEGGWAFSSLHLKTNAYLNLEEAKAELQRAINTRINLLSIGNNLPMFLYRFKDEQISKADCQIIEYILFKK